MTSQPRDERYVFVHIAKTAGSFVNRYVVRRVFGPSRFTILAARRFGLERDWISDEVTDHIRSAEPSRAYLHSHVENFTPEAIADLAAFGWTGFTFVRHPGDQWCSLWYWSRENDQEEPIGGDDLDAFLFGVFTGAPELDDDRRNLDIPDWWETLDFVAEYRSDTFAELLADHLGHTYTDDMEPWNVSTNEGYDHYRASGLISDRTHEAMLESVQWKRFAVIRELH